MSRRPLHRSLRAALLAAGCGSLLAACGSSAGLSTGTAPGGSMSAMTHTSTAGAPGSGMDMSATNARQTANGIKPIPTQLLASAEWQHMRITARAMTAVPFVVFDGSHERTIRPPKDTSFHLMVMLDDARTGVPIPYATVWATIRRSGRLVYDERQWPMLSEYMGPHYGNNVALPGPGRYTLSLLVGPPVSARHIEYAHVWLTPHRVTLPFTWKGGSS